MIKAIKCEIEGTSPILMNAFPMQPIEALEKKPPEEQAEFRAFRDSENGELYFPATNFQRGMVAAATFSKGKGRYSLQKECAASLFVSPEYLGFGCKAFVIDARPVVIQAAGKARVMRYRPRLNDWKLKFELEFDDSLMNERQVRKILDDLGTRVGIGDFRPEKKGPFGRFIVTNWTGVAKTKGKS